MKKTDQLIRKKKHGFHSEVTIAHLEEVFEGWSEQVDHHNVVITVPSGPHNPWHAKATHEGLVDLGLLLEGTVSCNSWF